MSDSENLQADLTHATNAMRQAIAQKDVPEGVVDAFNHLLDVFRNIDSRLVKLEEPEAD
ncbi:hypothetical protein [Pseudomonas sp. Z13]|uniref:hypothetical protein n=1 Tax=Pseudomonas sp. Z13 TaxID=2983409 RepID=UPI002E80EF29|nr:hypothetical protein [Pseudomonas sp. Z13]